MAPRKIKVIFWYIDLCHLPVVKWNHALPSNLFTYLFMFLDWKNGPALTGLYVRANAVQASKLGASMSKQVLRLEVQLSTTNSPNDKLRMPNRLMPDECTTRQMFQDTWGLLHNLALSLWNHNSTPIRWSQRGYFSHQNYLGRHSEYPKKSWKQGSQSFSWPWKWRILYMVVRALGKCLGRCQMMIICPEVSGYFSP